MKNLPTYNGGKSGNGTYQQIINRIPPHNIFITAFAGHCGIFQHIRRAPISIINDISQPVIDTWIRHFKTKEYPVTSELPDISRKFLHTSILPQVTLSCRDASEILSIYKDNPGTFIYCDPPYPRHTRTSQNTLYKSESAEALHVQLLQSIATAKCNVMVSTYENDLYTDTLKGWTKHSFMSTTRGGLREETIYYNYTSPAILHDFRYVGKDYRERERIKLRVKRWQSRLKLLDASERCAILSGIIQDNTAATNTILKLQ